MVFLLSAIFASVTLVDFSRPSNRLERSTECDKNMAYFKPQYFFLIFGANNRLNNSRKNATEATHVK